MKSSVFRRREEFPDLDFDDRQNRINLFLVNLAPNRAVRIQELARELHCVPK